MIDCDSLLGKIFEKIIINNNSGDDDSIIFYVSDGSVYSMKHDQDCSEHVYIEDINGSIDDLLFSSILVSEEISKVDENASESGTWTFYKFATVKGYVTIRWYGSSNGYYAEDVNLYKIRDCYPLKELRRKKIDIIKNS